MRIKNKYIRNRAYRAKHWHRIRNQNHPYETHMPWFYYNSMANYSAEEQVKHHFEWITTQARALENGHKYGLFHAPKDYRKTFNDRRKAQERTAMSKIRQGNYDVEMPVWKKDADWDYF